MDAIAFSFMGTPVSYGAAGLAGFIVLALLLVGVLVALMRGRSAQSGEQAAAAAEQLKAGFGEQIAYRDTQIAELQAREQKLVRSNTDLEARAAGLQVKLDEQSRNAAENLERFQNARQQMTDEFKLIAGEILKTNSEAFSKQNREQVDQLLKPLRDRIVEFQTGLTQDRATMKEQIRALAESNLMITNEAQNLTRALKGNAQSQGAWGEMILQTILERSGLREGEQFVTQTSHSADSGGRGRTEVEIIMPNGDKMVVDSKVSLTAFELFTNCEDETERAGHLSDHVRSIRGHIKTLAGKDYQRHAQSGLDFVLMFIPIEAAFSVAVTREPALLDEAIGMGVFITTPTTLMSALRTVRNVWDIEKRHQNAEEIADRAGQLYDKVHGFLSSMDKLDKHLDQARQSFDDAKGQLSQGRGNVVRQIEMLRDLGAKSAKTLPPGWESHDDDNVAQLSDVRAARGKPEPDGDD